jgi:hypothetical protein
MERAMVTVALRFMAALTLTLAVGLSPCMGPCKAGAAPMADCAQTMSHSSKHAPPLAPMKVVGACVLGCVVANHKAPEVQSASVVWTCAAFAPAADRVGHSAQIRAEDPPPRLRTV